MGTGWFKHGDLLVFTPVNTHMAAKLPHASERGFTMSYKPIAPRRRSRPFLLTLTCAVALATSILTITSRADKKPDAPFDQIISSNAERLLEQGRQTFRFDTFGSEAFWGGALQLQRAIIGSALGGVGPGVSPTAALAVGLKVDVDAIPEPVVNQLKQGKLDLNAPATTVALLKLNAVLGLTGFFDSAGALTSLGIQCALCHSTVDNSFAPGIG